jgi:hypothetical protein
MAGTTLAIAVAIARPAMTTQCNWKTLQTFPGANLQAVFFPAGAHQAIEIAPMKAAPNI